MRQLKAILADAFASRRAKLWYAVCAAAVGAVLLKEISLLLDSFQPSVGGQAYSASVFTRWRVNPITGADDIEAGWAVWTGSAPGWGLGRGGPPAAGSGPGGAALFQRPPRPDSGR